jgi:hypothetical protein
LQIWAFEQSNGFLVVGIVVSAVIKTRLACSLYRRQTRAQGSIDDGCSSAMANEQFSKIDH